MEIRRVFTIHKKAALFPLLLLLLVLSCPVHAQKLAAEVWGGYSYLRFQATKLGYANGLNLNGFNLGASLPNLYEGLGVAVDVSGHFDSPMEEFNFFVGPQYSYRWRGWRFYGHGLFGKARDRLRTPGTTAIEPSDLHKAFAFGGGVDYPFGDRIWLRPIQADYVITDAFGSTQHNARISTGIIYRFGKR